MTILHYIGLSCSQQTMRPEPCRCALRLSMRTTPIYLCALSLSKGLRQAQATPFDKLESVYQARASTPVAASISPRKSP
jgi:hypothetical protein